MVSHRQRHKAFLDQHVKDAAGEYHYIGDWYCLRGGNAALLPFLAAVALAGAAIVACGCITATGLKNTWYVIFSYIFEISLLFALVWQAARLAGGRGRLKAFVFEDVSPRVRPLCMGLALAAALSMVCSTVFLCANGPDGSLTACVGFFLLQALTAAASWFARRSYGRLEWTKQSSQTPAEPME